MALSIGFEVRAASESRPDLHDHLAGARLGHGLLLETDVPRAVVDDGAHRRAHPGTRTALRVLRDLTAATAPAKSDSGNFDGSRTSGSKRPDAMRSQASRRSTRLGEE